MPLLCQDSSLHRLAHFSTGKEVEKKSSVAFAVALGTLNMNVLYNHPEVSSGVNSLLQALRGKPCP